MKNEENFDNNYDSTCYNLTINFNKLNLFQAKEAFNNYQLKVYLLQLNDYFKKYTLIKLFNNYNKNHPLQTSLSSNNNDDDILRFTLRICNQNENLIQLQLKFQLEFIQAKKLFINFFDINLNELCIGNLNGNEIDNQKILNSKMLNLLSSRPNKTISMLSSSSSSIADEINNSVNNPPQAVVTNMKIHLLLPIILSSLFVAVFVLLAVFLRR